MKELLEIGIQYTQMGFILTAVYAFVLVILSRIIIRTYKKIGKRMILTKGKSAETIVDFTQKIIKVVVYAILIYLILIQFKAFSSLGTILLGTSSVLGVALALASQESMSNIVGGFFLAFYQPFRVEDLISIPEKNITGHIKEIGLRHTILVTFNNTEIVIPNSIMNSSIIENKDSHYPYRNFLIFSISYDSNVDQAIEVILEEARNQDLIIKEEGVENQNIACVVFNLNDYSVDLRLAFDTNNASDGLLVCCNLRKSVKEKFDQKGIAIPFPTYSIVK